MSQNWKPIWIAAAVAVGVVGVLVWKKKKRSFVKVGTISKLYFFPVKTLKGIRVTKGKCSKLGFEVDGLLDRSFMLVNNEGGLISQREAPSLVLLNLQINGNILLISTPSGKQLKVEIKNSMSPGDKIIQCRVHVDGTDGVDCGDEAASFFQTYLNMPGVHLVRHFPTLPKRKYLKNHPFLDKLRKENPIGFQDLAPLHILSTSTVDDLNSRLEEKKISELNFRPNMLVDGCEPYAEDSWRYIKFQSGVLLSNLQMVTSYLTLLRLVEGDETGVPEQVPIHAAKLERKRWKAWLPAVRQNCRDNLSCLMTTNDPATGILSQKEPLVTLRKYRIPKDSEIVKNIGSLPCLGIGCGVWKTGEISVGDDIFADVGPQPVMAVK